MVAGETSLSPRKAAGAIAVGVLSIVVLYVGVNVACFYALSLEEIAREKIVAARILAIALGPRGETVASVAILVSVLGALNGQFLAKTRVAYALARDGLGFKLLGRSHRTHATPYVSILVSTGVAAILVVSLKTFDALTAYFAPVEWTALLFGVGALFVLRRRGSGAPGAFRVPGYPWTPLFFVLSAGLSLAAVVTGEVLRRNYSPLVGLAIAGAGFPIHALRRRLATPRAGLSGEAGVPWIPRSDS